MTPSEPYYRKCNRCSNRFPVPMLDDNRKHPKVICNECNAKDARTHRAKYPERSREYAREYRKKNRERILETQKARYASNPERHRATNRAWGASNRSRVSKMNLVKRLRSFGVDITWYEETLKSQNGGCAICGSLSSKGTTKNAKFAIDHDHSCCPDKKACDKCRRGLLCFPCNTILARIEGDWLASALNYLHKFKVNNKAPSPLSHSRSSPDIQAESPEEM